MLVVGATSAIAAEVARLYATRGARLMLAGRRTEMLDLQSSDLRVRGASEVVVDRFDIDDLASHDEFIERAWSCWGGVDVLLIAVGVLPDQPTGQRSAMQTLESFDTNARSPIALLTPLANRFEAQGQGVIGVISSPAGDRGRASNYIYGAAKAALSNFCSGLRHRLHRQGVRVVTILPGFVDTPMTAGLRKDGPLWATPARVAKDIVGALDRRNGDLYTPWFWYWIMLIVRHVPQSLFLRSKL